MTILKSVDLEHGTVEVTEYSQTNAALTMLREKYAVVPDANTDEGYDFVKAGIKELTSLRTGLEAARKREKAPYLKAGEIIDAEAKRITVELVRLEDPMKAAKKEVDDRIERERVERIARLQLKVDAIKTMPTQVRGKSSAEISDMIDSCGEIDTAHDFYDLTKEAQTAQQAAMDELTQMLTDRLEFETAEEGRKKLEAQLAEQQAEMLRQQKAQQAEIQKQQDEINRQQEELRQQKAELEQARLAAQPQAEQIATVQQLEPEPVKPAEPLTVTAAPARRPTSQTQWHAQVIDKSALIAAIAAGYATEDLLIIDQPALDSLANGKRENLNLPGVIAKPSSAKAA